MIYFVRAADDGPIKIGYAVDVTKRVKQLATACHLKLSVIRVADGDRRKEQALHREFRHARIHNEWFRFDPRMLSIDLADLPIRERVARPVGRKPRVPREKMPPRAYRKVPPELRPVRLPKAPKPNGKITEWLDILGWSHRELAKRLKCDVKLILRWKSGNAVTPQRVTEWLEALTSDVKDIPIPKEWRVRK